jgi:threonyl-tRNA synthetase
MADMLGKHPRDESAPATEELIRRTLRFLMSVACERVFPNRRVTGGHAIGKGHWFKFEEEGPAQKTDTEKIVAEMRSLIKEAIPILRSDKSYQEMLTYFQQTSQEYAAKLLDQRVPLDGIVKVS